MMENKPAGCPRSPKHTDCEANFSDDKEKISGSTCSTSMIFDESDGKICRETGVERLCGQTLNPDQEKAASFDHTKSAVVTAAAGSGKTTLLVERVIRLLSDKQLNIPADSLAIMTFTRNATKSLREKLNKALNEKIGKLSEDGSEEAATERAYLSEQVFALRQASISTIDSFCLKIIKENAEAFDLPLNFTIADAAKKTALQSQAIKTAMQDFYNDNSDGEHAFSADERDTLFYSFNFENDGDLEEQIISAANELSSYSDAEKWLADAVDVYKDIHSLEKEYLKYYKTAVDFYVKNAEEAFSLYDGLVDKLKADAESKSKKGGISESLKTLINDIIPDIERYIEFDGARFEAIKKYYAAYNENPSFDTLGDLFAKAAELRNNPIKVDGKSGARSPYRTMFTSAKNAFQNTADGLLRLYFDKLRETETLPQQRTAIKSFVKLLKIYVEYFDYAKKSSGCLDFSDCELLLLKKLKADENFREQLSNRFSCIIVDEFQDSNDIQAEIFKLLGNGRLFYVGDVKQSIYAFRGGNPYIMAELCGGKDGFTALPLNTNYRSRKAVIETVNAAFSELMTEEYGGVNYADGNGLRLGAEFPEIAPENIAKYDSEIFLLNSPDKKSGNSDNDDNDDKDMISARFAARKIKELHDDENFLITKNGELCRCAYSDFAILLRTQTKIGAYRAALEELGISSVAPKGRNFLDTEEIALVLNFLKIIDNPLKDEEMLKVLMSPIYRFTAEEAAQLRLGILGVSPGALTKEQEKAVAGKSKSYSLHGCIRICSNPLDLSEFSDKEKGIVPREINPKLKQFTEDLNGFRYYMSSNPPDRLIRKIYEDTDITAIVAAFDDSAGRVSNVRRLERIAEDFEARDGGNLSDFLRFLERARANSKKGMEEAARPEDSADAVQIMTFHGSKGLEIPVCILSELQNKMNDSDYTGTLLMNREHFMAIKHTEIRKRYKSKTFAYCALERIIRKKLCGEELRLLYVAMTRAREKLIMIAKMSAKNLSEQTLDPDNTAETFEKSIPFKWILGSLLRYAPELNTGKSGQSNEDESRSIADINAICCRIKEFYTNGAAPESKEADKPEYDISDEEAEEISAVMNAEYKYSEDAVQQAKFSVTELAHRKSVKPVNLIKPDFANEGKPSGTERGNAYHHCMQYFPIENLKNADDSDFPDIVKKAIEEMVKAKRITRREADIIEPPHIAKFFLSELGKRMLSCSEIRREQPFYSEINGREVEQDYSGRVSVQGQIDMYFVEEDGIVVVDYKSDSSKNLEEEKENYALQVKIYSKILPQITGKAIKEMYLYAFSEDEAIKI